MKLIVCVTNFNIARNRIMDNPVTFAINRISSKLRLFGIALLSASALVAPSLSHAACNLDIDGNGHYDASTDGLLLMRHLLGFSGTALTQGAIGTGATRTDAAQVQAFINSQNYDIDGDGAQRGITDGLLALRYLGGLTGDALTQGAFTISAARTKSADVLTYLTTSNSCLLLPLGIQSLSLSSDTENSIYLMPGEIRQVTPQVILLSGVLRGNIAMSIVSGAANASVSQDINGAWSIAISSAGITTGNQLTAMLRVTNSATSLGADIPFTIKVRPPSFSAAGSVSSAGGSVSTSATPITFATNTLPTPANVVVSETVTPSGNTVMSIEFDQDVTPFNVSVTLPYLSPTTGGSPLSAGGAVEAIKAVGNPGKALSASSLVFPYFLDSNTLGYKWTTYSGYAFESSGAYRIPSETLLFCNDVQTISSPYVGTITIPAGYTVTGTRMRVKKITVAELHSVLALPVGTADVGAYEPILFVHGFTQGRDTRGGGKNTWQNFPALAMGSTHLGGRLLLPFEFRWNTNAHFVDAAAELALAIKQIKDTTGKKVHVVAHSFGGVLARTLLQGHVRGLPAGSTAVADARASVTSLITLGTPHSGIRDSASTVNGVALPSGQDAVSFEFCDQVSCHVLGEPALNGWISSAAIRNVIGVSSIAGEHAALLSSTASQLPAIPIFGGIGLSADVVDTSGTGSGPFNYVYRSGDFLISYLGQRFIPGDSTATALRSGATVGQSNVTEVVLGSTRSPTPGMQLAGTELADPDRKAGYRHSRITGIANWDGTDGSNTFAGWGLEAAPMKSCGTGTNCLHAGYLLLKRMLSNTLLPGNNGWVGGGSGRLNDTGITFSGEYPSGNNAGCTGGNNLAAQDCSLGRDTNPPAKVGGGEAGFDFTKISSRGGVLPASATLGTGSNDWACTRDNVTGLTWEVKTTNGLRSMNHTYTWYSSDSTNNAGTVGTASGGSCQTAGRCDTEKFVQDVNAIGLCGYNDWRMPHVKELEGIAYFGRITAVDLGYFINTPASFFWSRSPESGGANGAWSVHFSGGSAYPSGRSLSNRARLVRAPN